MNQGRSTFLTVMLYIGLTFLYVPMILLVIYSFNYSKLVPVCGDGQRAGTRFFLSPPKYGKPFASACRSHW